MKKLFFTLFLLLPSFIYAQSGYQGDGLGSHRATRDLNMNGKNINNAQEINAGTYYGSGASLVDVGLSTSSISSLPGNAGENIVKGQTVYVSGVLGNNLVYSLASRLGTTHKEQEAVGICGLTANTNAETLVITNGRLTGIKTNYTGWNESDELYLGINGALTNVVPSSGCVQFIGWVGRVHASAGSIIVQITHPTYRMTGIPGELFFSRLSLTGAYHILDGEGNYLYSITKTSASYQKEGFTLYIDTIVWADGTASTSTNSGTYAGGGGGGGVGFATYYWRLNGGGELEISTQTFSLSGAVIQADYNNTLTGIEFNALYTSTYSIWCRLTRSTCTDNTVVWDYITNEIEISSDTKSSGLIPVSVDINSGEYIGVHITNAQATGTKPSELITRIRHYRKED